MSNLYANLYNHIDTHEINKKKKVKSERRGKKSLVIINESYKIKY